MILFLKKDGIPESRSLEKLGESELKRSDLFHYCLFSIKNVLSLPCDFNEINWLIPLNQMGVSFLLFGFETKFILFHRKKGVLNELLPYFIGYLWYLLFDLLFLKEFSFYKISLEFLEIIFLNSFPHFGLMMVILLYNYFSINLNFLKMKFQ